MRSITLTTLFRCCLFAALAGSAPAQTQSSDSPFRSSLYRDNFRISPRDSIIHLRHQFILSGSVTVRLDSTVLSVANDYTIDARFGILRIHAGAFRHEQVNDSLFNLAVSYQALPFTFKDTYQRRVPVVILDTANGKKLLVSGREKSFSLDDLFGSNLQKSGSIVRGFTVGSNRDLSLNSGFRMQMAGNLGKDVSVVAALTDENSPLQPEGTTRTLREVDKVFVEIRGRNIGATLGDFNLDVGGSDFGRFSRKLQGAKAMGSYQNESGKGDVMVTGAVPRGKFTTNQVQGLDGVQGPYRLAGQNNERDIIVIAGTERVYINGEKMTRGDLYDYTIDYAIGEITFTSRRLVSTTSRITIDFEYTDRQYNRNLVAAQATTSFLNDRFTFNTTFLRESDDENSPLDLSLSDSDRVLLRLAGNDRLKATRSGIDSVGIGKGQYEALDTLVRLAGGVDTLLRIYRYNPIDTLRAVYSISFANVGFSQGEYERVTLTEYRFVGLRQGSYEPIRFLPLPKADMLVDFTLAGKVSEDLRLGGELALSNFDGNKFSTLQDNDNAGRAMKFALEYSPSALRFGGANLGSLNLALKERFIDKRYVSPDRINEIEFGRKWNITDTSKTNEELREAVASYRPVPSLTLGGSIGSITHEDAFSSDRYSGTVKLAANSLPTGEYQFEIVKSRNAREGISARWVRQHALAGTRAGMLTPHIGYNSEVLRNDGVPLSTLTGQSFRFDEFTSGAALDSMGKMSISAQYSLRIDDSLRSGALQHAATSLTQTYGWRLSEWNNLSSALDVTLQKKSFTEAFRSANADDPEGILLRSQTQFTPLDRGVESDFFYEVATGRSARMERIFQRVSRGTGNYLYIGDANSNHAVDEQDFQLTRFDGDFIAIMVPTDQFVPVVDLKASTRIRLRGDRLFAHPISWFERAFAILSTESYARVEEKSAEMDKKQIYLLHLSRFLDDRTTLSGSNILSQDVYVLENNPVLSIRFRYNQRQGLAQFALANERAYAREQSVRLRWQLIKEFANQIDIAVRRDILGANLASARERDIHANSFTIDWSYRPEQRVELGFKFSFGEGTNFDSTIADLNDQSVRLLYSFSDRGQVRGDFTREEVTIEKSQAVLPFELTGGRVVGRSWLWRIGIDYRVTQFIQGSMNYDGRSEGGGSPVHTARVEVRAFF